VRSAFLRYACIAGAMLAPVTDGWPHYWLFPFVAALAGIATVLRQRGIVGRTGSAIPRGLGTSRSLDGAT
jgi:hypothetical protein